MSLQFEIQEVYFSCALLRCVLRCMTVAYECKRLYFVTFVLYIYLILILNGLWAASEEYRLCCIG